MNSTPDEHSFFRWLRSLDLQRGPDRWIGGVASGLAARTRLDPILVRGIILIVVLFTGVGLFLYGLAWALLPGPTGRIHVQEIGRGNWTLGFSGALLLLILGTADWFSPRFWYRDGFDFGGIVLIGVVALVVWFFVARNRDRKAAETGGGPSAPSAAGTLPGAPGAAPFAAPAGYASGTTAPGPAPAPRPPRPPRPAPAPRPRHARLSGATTAIVLGLAVLAGSGVLAADFFARGDSFSLWAWTVAFAVAVAVLGAGLVVAALTKRSGGALTGWAVVLLIPAVVVGLFSGALGGTDYRNHGGFWAETYGSASEHGEGVYAFSRSRTDLTHLSSIEEDTSVPFNTAFSRTTVVVPADIPVYLDGAAPFMSVEVESADGVELLEISGVTTPQHHLLTGVTDGPSLTLDVNGAFSQVDIIVDGDGADLVEPDDFPWGGTDETDEDADSTPESTELHIQPLEPMEAAK
ncbi:PspC domain-containing protein [Zhihengliuella salsuginis]|uniref:Phage shock protein PspC N-terminal domain-containing protein n=1 Tax=Zhihengliuella salsuginis TaxID=578222 RepID=A0ABQ3GMG6_9MICC|nr:PspC domain-containing protein [Zhihengliuella salsuginis]GHD13450.1 hypothetical protein GCM10008096_29650 [Zhihengliuella salsuginis]